MSLARVTPVIYFEPPWDTLVGIIKNPLKWIRRYTQEKKLSIDEIYQKNLKRIRLFSIFPWKWTNRWISALNKTFVLLQIKWHIKAYDPRNRILLTYWRDSVDIIRKIPAYRRVYHCLHEIAGFPWPSEEAKTRAITEEIKVAKTVDSVLVVSHTLTQKMSQYNKNVKLLEDDVVDFELFNKGFSKPVPDKFKHLPRPIAGYVGNLSRFKQDFNLIDRIAYALPNWSFVIIGPKYDELPSRKNIIYLGPRYYEEIPKYIAAFDVCIIPPNNNSYIRHSFTMKLFQYLALGKPAVATDKPLQVYKDYIYLVKNDPNDFVAALQKALQEKPERKQSRIKLAKDHNWNIRAHEIFNLLIGTKACK